MNTAKQALKDRLRAEQKTRREMPAREYLYHLLCATNTPADAEVILDRFAADVLNADADPMAEVKSALLSAAERAVSHQYDLSSADLESLGVTGR